jgi:small subunit ribosomal protein S16
MALKIRLRQQGRTNLAFYRLVVTDSRSPRDGKYVEALGWYNPIVAEEAKKLAVNEERVQHWLNVGAQLSDNVENLLRRSSPHIVKTVVEKKQAQKARVVAKRKARKKVKA